MNVKSVPNIGIQTVSQVAGLNAKANFIQPVKTPATLVSCIATNAGASTIWLQLWDANSATDAQAVQLHAFPIPPDNVLSLDTPIKFLRGIYLVEATQDTSANPLANMGGTVPGTPGAGDLWIITRHL